MKPVLSLMAEGARFRSCFPSGEAVAPAFILDARRDGEGRVPPPGGFDNRWTIFPSDLPSASHLRAVEIGVVTVIHDGVEVREDVQAIAWSYRSGGLAVRILNVRDGTVVAMSAAPPGWLPRMIDGIRRRFSLRRRSDGSYGYRVPVPPEPSHG